MPIDKTRGLIATIQLQHSPFAPDGTRLYFRPSYKRRLNPGPRHKLRNTWMNTPLRQPLNMVTTCRLLRWAHEAFQHVIGRDQIYDVYFDDFPDITIKRMGVIVMDAVQYSPQYSTKGINYFRFQHQLDIIYGLERQMASWLEPFFRQIDQEEFEEFEGPSRIREEIAAILERPMEDDISYIYEPALELGTLWAHSDNPREYTKRPSRAQQMAEQRRRRVAQYEQ